MPEPIAITAPQAAPAFDLPGAVLAPAAPAPRGFALSRPVRMPTLMLVEDSRYASEVLRLYARALGLRLRRAADLETAHTHLRLYRPDIAMVDLGLPDGRGEGLIAVLCQSTPRPPLIIAVSGQPDRKDAAIIAGADLFLEKPLPDLTAFRALLVDHFPSPLPLLLLPERSPQPHPDKLALQDDLNLAAQNLADEGASALPTTRSRYVAGLVDGLAGSLGDTALQQAARQHMADLGDGGPVAPQGGNFRQLRDLVNERLRDVMADRHL